MAFLMENKFNWNVIKRLNRGQAQAWLEKLLANPFYISSWFKWVNIKSSVLSDPDINWQEIQADHTSGFGGQMEEWMRV